MRWLNIIGVCQKGEVAKYYWCVLKGCVRECDNSISQEMDERGFDFYENGCCYLTFERVSFCLVFFFKKKHLNCWWPLVSKFWSLCFSNWCHLLVAPSRQEVFCNLIFNCNILGEGFYELLRA
jgi:hypothetical protein